jgi:hypothetical protein
MNFEEIKKSYSYKKKTLAQPNLSINLTQLQHLHNAFVNPNHPSTHT